MLYFYKNSTDDLGKEIAEFLEDFSIAHKLETTEKESFLKENELAITGADSIRFFLDNYGKITVIPHSISADACRIDPETGQVC